MRILFVTTRNRSFWTITEYIERALLSYGHDVRWFDDDALMLPGHIRKMCRSTSVIDVWNLNRRLRRWMTKQEGELLLCAGGERVLPSTLDAAHQGGMESVLWTIDTVKPEDPRLRIAPHFGTVFCGGTEMLHYLRAARVQRGPFWLPFACDPDVHCPVDLSPSEKARFGNDIAFVGSMHPELYPSRIAMLSALVDFDLGVWGPGANRLPLDSPLRRRVRGEGVQPQEWRRIYSAAKIVVCSHYDGPGPPCRQASPRVFEALACGAFLICDNQQDVAALFKDGEDLVFYRTLDDLQAKMAYYLAHPRERREIAANGRRKVLAEHTYRHRVARILKPTSGPIDATEDHSRR
jgi:spore maturation protein CgeB